jgi:dolichol-phosphate mannosyltransferase
MEEFLRKLPCPVEVIFVNDGSSDGTLAMLKEWSEADGRIKVVALARNFGHQLAATAGLDHAAGEAIVVMDADLQDPPEVIIEMLDEYRKGYDVVYGQRISRAGESAFKRVSAWIFYRGIRALGYPQLPPDTGDFRLVSRRCLETIREMREEHRFLRGMFAWVGFAQTAVRFHRHERVAGETKYPLKKMLRLAGDGVFSFSIVPLRLSTYLGAAVVFAGLCVALCAVLRFIFAPEAVSNWMLLLLAVGCLLGGAILLAIGLLGEYIGRIFMQVKNRPLYVVACRFNLPGPGV